MKRWMTGCTVATVVLTLVLGASPARADDKQDAAQLVEKARLTVEQFQSEKGMENFRELSKRAKGFLVLPQMLRAAFLVGASGGNGVLVVRDDAAGKWNGPAFYTIGGASFGFQAGADAAEVIILVMTDRGVTALLGNQVKLGADISATAGPVGGGTGAATAGLSGDIVYYSMSKGLYGGFSVDGSVVGVRAALNEAFYGKPASTTDILVKAAVKSPAADPLIERIKALSGR